MKMVHESVFMSTLRAFFGVLFGVLGALVALTVGVVLVAALYSSDKEAFTSSKVELLPDANGNRKELSRSTPVLVQISLDGKIGTGKRKGSDIEEILLDSREDDFKNDRVKGILLVINSPGGAVNDSDQIYHLIKDYKKKHNIPIYTFVDGMAASGGYYIACASDKIFASTVSLIGSVGVISYPPFINIHDALEKIGISSLTISAGKGKDLLNPFRPWKEGEQDHYQDLINYFYEQFVAIVIENRPKIDKEELIKTLGAQVYPAPQAEAIGMVDVAGATRAQALDALAAAAGVEEKYQVVGFKTKSWWKEALNGEASLKHELKLPTQKSPSLHYE